jgi:hypothetical protein
LGGGTIKKINVFLFCVLASLVTCPLASQAQHFMPLTKPHATGGGPGAINGGPYPPGFNLESVISGSGLPLLYFGGPVISNVKAVVVLWGNNVDPRITTRIGSFYRSVTDSNYVTWLSPQYDTSRTAVNGLPGTNQKIGAGTFLGTFTIQPAVTQGTIDDTAIQAELQNQISGGHLPAQDADTLYMVYFPPGLNITAFGLTSCQQFCAYHSFDGLPDPLERHIFYGVIPDISACFGGCHSTPPNPPSSIPSPQSRVTSLKKPSPTHSPLRETRQLSRRRGMTRTDLRSVISARLRQTSLRPSSSTGQTRYCPIRAKKSSGYKASGETTAAAALRDCGQGIEESLAM